MKEVNFLKAIQLISESHSSQILINYAKPSETVKTGSNNLTIHIVACCAAVINRLIKDGYSLSMKDGKTEVNFY